MNDSDTCNKYFYRDKVSERKKTILQATSKMTKADENKSNKFQFPYGRNGIHSDMWHW